MPRVKLFDETQVLEKAMELFWKQGYHATSMQNLVDYLEINRASIYDTYGGKKELFLKAFQYYQQINRTRLRTFLMAQESVKEGLRALFYNSIRQDCEDSDKKGCFVVNAIIELIPNDEDMLPLFQEHQSKVEELFRAFLQKGVATGELSQDKDLSTLASTFFTFYSGMKVMSKVNQSSEALQKIVNITLSVLD